MAKEQVDSIQEFARVIISSLGITEPVRELELYCNVGSITLTYLLDGNEEPIVKEVDFDNRLRSLLFESFEIPPTTSELEIILKPQMLPYMLLTVEHPAFDREKVAELCSVFKES